MVDDDAPKRAVEDYRLELERRLPRCSPSRALPRFRSLSKTTVAWFLKPHTSTSIPSRHGVVRFKFSVLAFFRARLGCGKIPPRTRPQPDLELVEHGEWMSERQIIQRELGMGLDRGGGIAKAPK
jgi:hypothetical protein